jgi:hypothetical protein
MSAELFLQKVVRDALTAAAGVVALVPAANILDRNERPNPRPSIVLGEGQSVDEGYSIARTQLRVYLDLHIWVEEESTETCKRIAGAIRSALRPRLRGTVVGFHIADCRVRGTRFLRDPDGRTSHGVVTVDALMLELI